MPDVPQDACHRTPELVNAVEGSQETTPSGDCLAPITPASQDTECPWIADLNPETFDLNPDTFETLSFDIPGQGDPWDEFLAYGPNPSQ